MVGLVGLPWLLAQRGQWRAQTGLLLLAGDAADLQENLDDEIAPGGLWRGNEVQAITRIRKLKALAADTGARIWPNHDMDFYKQREPFPKAYE